MDTTIQINKVIEINDILSLISIIVSLIALGITMYSLKKQIRFNELTLSPYCNLYHDIVGNKVTILMENAGNGPMIILKEGQKYKKKTLQGWSVDYLCECISTGYDVRMSENNLSGIVLPAASKQTILEAEFPSIERMRECLGQTQGVILHIEYEDAYHVQHQPIELDLGDQFKRYLCVYNSINNEDATLGVS